MQVAYDPRHFLVIADRLLRDSHYEPEGRIRTAIGRAYYAAFLVAKKKLQEQGYSFRRIHRLHKDVIDRIMENGHYSIGSKLNTLLDHRVDADYKMMARISSTLGQSSIRLAEAVINAIEQV